MSDTPRTDAVHFELARYKRNTGGDARTALNHARQLEREATALRSALTFILGVAEQSFKDEHGEMFQFERDAIDMAKAALSPPHSERTE